MCKMVVQLKERKKSWEMGVMGAEQISHHSSGLETWTGLESLATAH
jgi:hypothetical protein